MALPPSGPISMSQINTELSVPATTLISLNQANARALAQVPAGMISLSNFYGKSNISGAGWRMGGWNGGSPGVLSPQLAILKYSFTTETASIIGQTTVTRQNPVTPPVQIGYTSQMVLGFSPTAGYGLKTGPGNTTPLWNYSFTFSNETITQLAQQPLGYQTAYSRMQTETNLYSTSQGQPNLNNAYIHRFNMPTQTQQLNIYSIPNSTTVPANANNVFNNWSFSGLKNYQKGYSNGGIRPAPGPGFVVAPAVFGYVVQFPTETGYVNPVSLVRSGGGAPIFNAEVGYGYSVTNLPATPTTFAYKYPFATETGINNAVNVGENWNYGTSWQTPVAGYLYGGISGAVLYNSTNFLQQVRKFDFSTETKTVQSVGLGIFLNSMIGMQNSNYYG